MTRFKLLYVWLAIDHARREVLHSNVTANPTSAWVIQQLRDSIPQLGIESRRNYTASPWQNGLAERWVGTVRRELLDHVVVLDERHLCRLMREYVDYYNRDQVHTCLRDAPIGREVESRPTAGNQVIGLPPGRGTLSPLHVGGYRLKLVFHPAATCQMNFEHRQREIAIESGRLSFLTIRDSVSDEH